MKDDLKLSGAAGITHYRPDVTCLDVLCGAKVGGMVTEIANVDCPACTEQYHAIAKDAAAALATKMPEPGKDGNTEAMRAQARELRLYATRIERECGHRPTLSGRSVMVVHGTLNRITDTVGAMRARLLSIDVGNRESVR